MRGAGSKNAWALFLLILAGIVLDTDCFEPRTCRYYVWSYD